MTDPKTPYIDQRTDVEQLRAQEMEKVEADCRQRMTKIRQNAHMKDVVQLKEVTLPASLRAHALEIRPLHQLHALAETRVRELMDGHLIEMRRQQSVQGLEQLRSHFVHREWAFIKGPFPNMYKEGEREAEKLLTRLEYETASRRRGKPQK